jgi:hypothetical protein
VALDESPLDDEAVADRIRLGSPEWTKPTPG